MARTIVDICNGALGELPAGQITDIDDESEMGARHCKRLYPVVVSDLLEMHDWDFSIRRAALAPVANTRSGEWAVAYALPNDLRSPISLLPSFATGGAGYYSAASMGIAGQLHDMIPFSIADGVIYTSLQGAYLEYVADNILVTSFTSMFARAVELELASRLVMPVLNDRARQRELIQMAEIARDRAVADDANRNRNNSQDFVSERAMARGVFADPYALGYRG